MNRKAAFSRVSGSLAENCHATAAADETSITESRPKPINADDDARALGQGDHRLDDVVGDGGGDQQPDAARETCQARG